MTAHVIYALKCPRTLKVRYIGFTSMRIEKRLWAHVARARSGKTAPCSVWIRELLLSGSLPIIEVIESVNSCDWQERERYWIAEFGGMEKLLNRQTGGDTGHQPSEETKRKRSKALRGVKTGPRSQEFCDKMSRILRGKSRRPMSDNHRAAISKALTGRTFSPAHCAGISLAKKGVKFTPEHRASLSLAAKNRHHGT